MMKNKGIIPINKPSNWTSFDVVNKIKHLVKPLKVGHLGTLDPMATGVLLVTIGKATKLFDLMQEKKKTYIASFEFGVLTDTLDSTGKEIERKATNLITKENIEKVLTKFIGKIKQIPPLYSAKSINGVRAYDLARKGIEFELKPKTVEIFNIKLLNFIDKSIELEITCGSGTYIRAIGRDIANELNTVATMTSLVRTSVGNFNLQNCHNIQDVAQNPENYVKPIKEVLNYPSIEIDNITKNKLLNGLTININNEDGIYAINNNDDTVALVKINNNLAKMFLFLG